MNAKLYSEAEDDEVVDGEVALEVEGDFNLEVAAESKVEAETDAEGMLEEDAASTDVVEAIAVSDVGVEGTLEVVTGELAVEFEFAFEFEVDDPP